MGKMARYCKAYPANRFRQFAGWSEQRHTAAQADDGSLSIDEEYFFLNENLIVTEGVFMDEDIVFDQVSPQWEEFCRKELDFQIPQDVLSIMGEPDNISEPS